MRPYKLKRLENVENDKKQIIENTWRKVKQPERKKQANSLKLAIASLASITLVVLLSWSFIVSPNNSQIDMPIEGVPLLENIESIEIWENGSGDSVVIMEESQVQALYEIISSVLQQSVNGQLQTDDYYYSLQINERGFYPRGHFYVTKNQLFYLSMAASITDAQYKIIKELFQNQMLIDESLKWQPITEKDGLFYFDVLALGDSKSAMIGQYGYHYTERFNDNGNYNADTIYDYGTIKVYMRDDRIMAIKNQHFYSVDFDDIYGTFLKLGFVEENPDAAYMSSFYSKASNQQITFETNPSGTLTATLQYKMSSE